MRHRLLLIMLMLGAGIGAAQAAVGPYAGASVGNSSISDDSSSPPLNFDESDHGYRVFGGFRSMFLGIEAGYVDFGSPEGSAGGGLDAKVEASGWDLMAIGTIPLGKRFEIFGKFGVVKWDTKITINNGISDSASGSDNMWGAGVALRFGSHLAARLEYGNYNVSSLDTVELKSAGLEFRF
jgi:Outer membrane protein beta-barrel domain